MCNENGIKKKRKKKNRCTKYNSNGIILPSQGNGISYSQVDIARKMHKLRSFMFFVTCICIHSFNTTIQYLYALWYKTVHIWIVCCGISCRKCSGEKLGCG